VRGVGGRIFNLRARAERLPPSFNSASVSVKDSAGNVTAAPLLFVSPNQVTFEVPSTVAAGAAQVSVSSNGSTQTATNVVIAPVAPSVFVLNGSGLIVGWATRFSSANVVTIELPYALNMQGSFSSAPVSLGSATDKVYLSFYATGVQAAGIANVTVTVNGVNVPVLYAGNGGFMGVDQINVQLPASLAGAGTVTVQVTASGIAANPVQIQIQ
jgi:uncharacterized protein (TIGR03437 family)